MCQCCFTNNYDRDGLVSLDINEISIQLPKFAEVITNVDLGIQYIVLERDPNNSLKVSLDIYWIDEWHPCFCIDWIYRLIRKCQYKRTYDSQSLKILLNKDKQITNIYSANWADDGSMYNICVAKHRCFDFVTNSFEILGNTPIVYVSTWNHMFSREALDPIEYIKNRNVPIYCKTEEVDYFTGTD